MSYLLAIKLGPTVLYSRFGHHMHKQNFVNIGFVTLPPTIFLAKINQVHRCRARPQSTLTRARENRRI